MIINLSTMFKLLETKSKSKLTMRTTLIYSFVLLGVFMLLNSCNSDDLQSDVTFQVFEKTIDNPFTIAENDILGQSISFLNQISENDKSTLRSFSQDEVLSEISVTNFSVELAAESAANSYKVKQNVPVYTVNFKDRHGKSAGFVIKVGDERISSPILVFSNNEDNFSFSSEYDKEFMEDLWSGYIYNSINNPVESSKDDAVGLRSSFPTTYNLPMNGDYDQLGDPWSRYTPFRDGSRTLAGCTAVAMARIMGYHGWPKYGA